MKEFINWVNNSPDGYKLRCFEDANLLLRNPIHYLTECGFIFERVFMKDDLKIFKYKCKISDNEYEIATYPDLTYNEEFPIKIRTVKL